MDHASPDQSKEKLGLTPSQMADRILERFGPVFRATVPTALAV